jgi:hypothetical protein
MRLLNRIAAIFLSILFLFEVFSLSGETLQLQTIGSCKSEVKHAAECTSIPALAILPELKEQKDGVKHGVGSVAHFAEFTLGFSFPLSAALAGKPRSLCSNDLTPVYLRVRNQRL